MVTFWRFNKSCIFCLRLLISGPGVDLLGSVTACLCFVCVSLWRLSSGVLIVLVCFLEYSLGIPEGKKNPRSFLRSPSPPGEGSGRWWPWTFTMASRFGKSAVAPSLIKNTPLASAASLLSCACDRAALISCLIFALKIFVSWSVPPSLGRFLIIVHLSSLDPRLLVVAATSSWSLVVGLI